jgi:hypothetical protein
LKFRQTASKICREMDTQDAPLPFGEDIENRSRLCRLHRAEGEFVAGNGKVNSIEMGEPLALRELAIGEIEPAEPLVFVRAGPESLNAIPQPFDIDAG